MLIVPEARAAIFRTIVVAAVAVVCIVGAIRTDRRWVRILLSVVAIPLTLVGLFGISVVYLIMEYGPR
jgi:hypothetical protein